MALTRGFLTQHFKGNKGGFYPAMLDVAQDHLLYHLHDIGLFELGLVFKGGTSLRKMRAGAGGRFSTDLDFCAPDADLQAEVLNAIEDVTIGPFRFVLDNREATRSDLVVTGPFGSQNAETGPTVLQIKSKVDMSLKAPWLAPQVLPFLALPVHKSYELAGGLPSLPVVRSEEAIAEKLARYSRVGLARDLFDLAWYGRQGAMEEGLIRRLWVLKVYQDVVTDNRWDRPFNPDEILAPRKETEIQTENIGYLTVPSDIPGWEREFRARYAFLPDLDEEEWEWARCHAGRQWDFDQAVAAAAIRAAERRGGNTKPG